jgi:hypothetical protein
MKLRELNGKGLAEASRILDAIRSGEETAIPDSFLENDEFSNALDPSIAKPRKGELATRWQLGLWLFRQLNDAVSERDLYNRPGMWSWLSFYLFDIICPLREGARDVAEDAKYLLSKGDYRKAYRHLVAGPYYMIRAYIDTPAIVRAPLNNPPDSPGDLYEQLAARKQIVTSAAAMSLANTMYWRKEGGVKRGAAGAGAGSARRFATVLMQYDVTYDLFAISEEQLRALLPREFDRFLTPD